MPYSDVNAATTEGATALMIATQASNLEMMSSLLFHSDGRLDVNQAEHGGNTALHIAASQDAAHADSVGLLLKAHGIDVNRKSVGGLCALYHAAQNGHLQTVRLLLGVEQIDVRARTALIYF